MDEAWKSPGVSAPNRDYVILWTRNSEVGDMVLAGLQLADGSFRQAAIPLVAYIDGEGDPDPLKYLVPREEEHP